MKQWMLYTRRADFYEIGARFNISPVTARIIVNRGIAEEDMENYLRGGLKDLHSPKLLKDIEYAAELIMQDIEAGRRIRIVGDYDIDGVCSTYIYMKALKRLGADVDYEIPHRIHDGYGINESIIRAAADEGIDTILTCDNGIAAFAAADEARKLGLRLIITDHHEVFRDESGEERLPEAEAIVNPKQDGCTYPFESICGGMVAYKLVQVLYEAARIESDGIDELIEIAAVATVGDVMPLIDENRIIVREGLKRLENTSNTGLRELIAACGLQGRRMSAYHIGYVIGPCLNAGGRLDSAKIALRLLLSEDRTEAAEFAQRLRDLNDERKNLTARGLKEAERIAEEHFSENRVLVIYIPDCHESLAGIIAGRLREKYYKPSIVLTESENGLLKGSGRSIDGYHMFERLNEASEYLEKYGGHPKAAGLSLLPEKLDSFREFLERHSGLGDEDMKEKVWIDTELPFSYISEEFIEELDMLEPFGQKNEKPVFGQRAVKILNLRVMGREHNVVKLWLKDGEGECMDALVFTDGDGFANAAAGYEFMDILYYPQTNEYMGRRALQIVIRDWKFR